MIWFSALFPNDFASTAQVSWMVTSKSNGQVFAQSNIPFNLNNKFFSFLFLSSRYNSSRMEIRCPPILKLYFNKIFNICFYIHIILFFSNVRWKRKIGWKTGHKIISFIKLYRQISCKYHAFQDEIMMSLNYFIILHILFHFKTSFLFAAFCLIIFFPSTIIN